MSLAEITLALLLSLPCPREPAEAAICRDWRATIAPPIAEAAAAATADGTWPGEADSLAALLVAVGNMESGFRRRIQAGECRPRECDSFRAGGRWTYPAQTMWQQHQWPQKRAEWRKMIGTSPEAVRLAATEAARRLSRGFRGCKTIAGAVSQYGGAQGCGWPGASGREKLHRKLLAQAREAAK